jgi:hypothetical protein
MNFFQKLFGSAPTVQPPAVTPQTARRQGSESATTSTQGPRQINPANRNYYDALNDSDDRTPVPVAVFYALKQVVKGLSRERLALLGDYLFDNDGSVFYAVDTIANYSVPITPIATTKNTDWNKAADRFWSDWTKVADYTGRFDLTAMQRQACYAIDKHGEIGAVMTTESGMPQLQFIETYGIGFPYAQAPEQGQIDGVSVTPKGVLQGFFVREDLLVPQKPTFVSANEMKLLYDADRYIQYRGISPIRRGANDIRDAKDIKAFEKLATKLSSALAAVLEGSDFEEQNVWGEDAGNEADVPPGTIEGNTPPSDATQFEKNLSIAELLGGDILTLPEGKKLKQLDNNRPGERVLDMVNVLAGCFVAGLGMPPGFLLDSKGTGPNQRTVNGKAQRKFNQRQEMMAGFIHWLWVRVIGWAIDTKQLPAQEGWDRIEWQGPPKVSIDDGRDAKQWRDDFQSGLMTRQEHYGNRALGWLQQVDQGFAEDDYILAKATETANKHKVPVEWILTRWGYTAAKPATQQQNQPNSNESGNEPNTPAAD